jgi:hypothetical protein
MIFKNPVGGCRVVVEKGSANGSIHGTQDIHAKERPWEQGILRELRL